MIIEIEKLNDLVCNADKIVLSADGENVIIQLLTLEKQIEQGIKTAKMMIEKKVIELNPNLKSITSDNLRISYRQYGAKYRIEDSFFDKLDPSFYKVSKRYDVVAEEVEKYCEEHKSLPIGINEIERPKSLSFSLKGEKDNE